MTKQGLPVNSLPTESSNFCHFIPGGEAWEHDSVKEKDISVHFSLSGRETRKSESSALAERNGERELSGRDGGERRVTKAPT